MAEPEKQDANLERKEDKGVNSMRLQGNLLLPEQPLTPLALALQYHVADFG